MSDILTGTPSSLTYEHELVRQAWTAAWMVATGVLGIALGWMGLTLIVQEHLGRPSAGWKEMIPRLCLGLAAASSSLWWCAMIIDLSDAVSGYLAAALSVTPGDLLRAPLTVLLRAIDAGSVGMGILIAAIYLVYGLFVLIVLAQMIIRLALIDLLLALAPVALGLWILPHAAGWGRHWLRLFMTTVFQQSVQLIALALGFGFIDEFAGITAGYEPAQDLSVEAPHVRRVRLPGHPRSIPAGQRRCLRRMGADDLLRHEHGRWPRTIRPDADHAGRNSRGSGHRGRIRRRRHGFERGRDSQLRGSLRGRDVIGAKPVERRSPERQRVVPVDADEDAKEEEHVRIESAATWTKTLARQAKELKRRIDERCKISYRRYRTW